MNFYFQNNLHMIKNFWAVLPVVPVLKTAMIYTTFINASNSNLEQNKFIFGLSLHWPSRNWISMACFFYLMEDQQIQDITARSHCRSPSWNKCGVQILLNVAFSSAWRQLQIKSFLVTLLTLCQWCLSITILTKDSRHSRIHKLHSTRPSKMEPTAAETMWDELTVTPIPCPLEPLGMRR